MNLLLGEFFLSFSHHLSTNETQAIRPFSTANMPSDAVLFACIFFLMWLWQSARTMQQTKQKPQDSNDMPPETVLICCIFVLMWLRHSFHETPLPQVIPLIGLTLRSLACNRLLTTHNIKASIQNVYGAANKELIFKKMQAMLAAPRHMQNLPAKCLKKSQSVTKSDHLN